MASIQIRRMPAELSLARSLDRHRKDTIVSVRTSRSGVKNGRASGGTRMTAAGYLQKPLSASSRAAISPPAHGTRKRAEGGTHKAVAPGGTNGQADSLPGLLVDHPHVNGAANGLMYRRPRQPSSVNTLTVDDDDEPGETAATDAESPRTSSAASTSGPRGTISPGRSARTGSRTSPAEQGRVPGARPGRVLVRPVEERAEKLLARGT